MVHIVNIEDGDERKPAACKPDDRPEPPGDDHAAPPAESPAPEAQTTAPEPEKTPEQEFAELRNLLQMREAEFRNFRKRSFKERDDIRLRARHDVMHELFPVIDNFERALKHAPPAGKCAVDAFVRGVEMTYNELIRLLESFDVHKIDEAGMPFDPALHEAVSTVETDAQPDCTVVEVLQTGYRHGDQALRAAQVVIARQPTSDEQSCACEAETGGD